MGQSQSIQHQSFEFALSIIRLYKKLQARQEFILSPLLLKSGTSIGVAVEEAIALQLPETNAEEASETEAIDRLKLACRTALETRYWLKLLQESKLADVDVTSEIEEVDALLYNLKRMFEK
jgi:four helix bundle protein